MLWHFQNIKGKSCHSVPVLQVHLFKPHETYLVPFKDSIQSSGSELREVPVKTENTLDVEAYNIPSLLATVTGNQSDDRHTETGKYLIVIHVYIYCA